MNPQQNQPNYSMDYLNQIAPQPSSGFFDNRTKKLLIIVGSVLLGSILIMIIFSALSGNQTEKIQTVTARLSVIESVANNSQKTIKNPDLRSLNSALVLSLSNTNRDIKAPIDEMKIKTTIIDELIAGKESGQPLLDILEDARLNAVFDRTYANEISYNLEITLITLKDLSESASNDSLRSVLSQAYNDLEPLQAQFETFNAANS